MVAPVSGSFGVQGSMQKVSQGEETGQPFVPQSEAGFDPTRWYLLTAGLSISVPLAVAGIPAARRLLLAEGEVLKAALGKVKAPQISQDVTYLASEALAGRGTPSEGLTLAGKHVTERMTAHGWKPGGPTGTYEYKYALRRARLEKDKTALSFNVGGRRRDHNLGEDYYYGSLSTQKGLVQEDVAEGGQLVFAGAGSEEELAGLDLRGKWMVCHDISIPSSLRRKNAIDAGARGVIVLPPKGRLDPHYAKRLETRLAMAKGGEAVFSPDDTIDEIVLGPKAAKKLFGGSGLLRSPGFQLGHGVTSGRGLLEVNVTRHAEEGVEMAEASNFVGFLPGTDPEKSKEVIIISAHLDHLGKSWGQIYPGADDNASGSSALLALAEAIPELRQERSVLLIWTTGEELGLLGSEAWARKPWLPAGTRPFANINIDMVGRNKPDELLITPSSRLTEHYNGIVRLFERNAPLEGIKPLKSADRYWERSDHYSFVQYLRIPAAFITNDTHPDYHQVTDLASKIDPETIARRTRLVVRVLDGMRGSLD